MDRELRRDLATLSRESDGTNNKTFLSILLEEIPWKYGYCIVRNIAGMITEVRQLELNVVINGTRQALDNNSSRVNVTSFRGELEWVQTGLPQNSYRGKSPTQDRARHVKIVNIGAAVQSSYVVGVTTEVQEANRLANETYVLYI